MEKIFSSNPLFMPSPSTTKLWFSTRKTESLFKKEQGWPRLFQTKAFNRDTLLFSLAIVLDIIGLAFFFMYFGILLFSVLFFLLSIIMAIGSHWNRGRMTELKVQITLLNFDDRFMFAELNDGTGTELKHMEKRLAWRKKALLHFNLHRWVFYLLILLLALFKIDGFFVGLTSAPPQTGKFAIAGFVTLSFVIVALIHIFVTGYYFSELMFRTRVRKEVQEHLRNRSYCNPGLGSDPIEPFLQITIPNPDNLTFPGGTDPRLPNTGQDLHGLFPRPHIRQDMHRLEYNTLSTCGILSDDQKFAMAGQITDPDPVKQKQKQDAFLAYATYHQLIDIACLNPIQYTTTKSDHPLPLVPDPPMPSPPLAE